MRPFRDNRWSSQISLFIPVCVQWSSHTLQRQLRKDKKEQDFSSRVCPSVWKRRELGKGVFGWGEPTSPWKRREWLGVGLYNGQARMGHPQPGHGAAALALENSSTDGSTDWPQREGDGTRSSLSTAFHLGRGRDPQRPRARPGAVAGDWQEGLWCQQVFQETSRGQPGYQPLCWAGCHGKSWESSWRKVVPVAGKEDVVGILSGGGRHCAWSESGLRKQHGDRGLQDVRKSPANVFEHRSSRDSCKKSLI